MHREIERERTNRNYVIPNSLSPLPYVSLSSLIPLKIFCCGVKQRRVSLFYNEDQSREKLVCAWGARCSPPLAEDLDNLLGQLFETLQLKYHKNHHIGGDKCYEIDSAGEGDGWIDSHYVLPVLVLLCISVSVYLVDRISLILHPQ
jgi:hypothetical protein